MMNLLIMSMCLSGMLILDFRPLAIFQAILQLVWFGYSYAVVQSLHSQFRAEKERAFQVAPRGVV